MKRLARNLASGGCAAVLAAAHAPIFAQSEPAPDEPLESEAEAPAPPSKGEAQLANLLKGRTAGEPVECLPPARTMPSRTIDQTAIVYGRGSTLYVQRTQAPQLLDRNTYLVSMLGQTNRFCRMDQFNVVDGMLGIPVAAVVFEKFIPYTRTRSDSSAGKAKD